MIKYIILIVLVFAIIILGQQAYFQSLGTKVIEWGSLIWQKCQDYWNKNILRKVTTEIEKRQNIAKEEIKEQTKEVTLTVWQKVKNYISGLINGVLGQPSQ
ncbi:hypothetical protein KJ786_02510 [Patescibacteria group bacterium]|nr:hypothetical protein [Patescibacteria group bacterium]